MNKGPFTIFVTYDEPYPEEVTCSSFELALRLGFCLHAHGQEKPDLTIQDNDGATLATMSETSPNSTWTIHTKETPT